MAHHADPSTLPEDSKSGPAGDRKLRTDRKRIFRPAIAAGALLVIAAITAVGANLSSVDSTDAAFVDREFARADIRASWPLAFANVMTASAQSSNPIIVSDFDKDSYARTNIFKQNLTDPASGPGTQPLNKEIYSGTGNPLNDPTGTPYILDLDNRRVDLHNGWGLPEMNGSSPWGEPAVLRCLVISDTLTPSPTNDPRCNLGTGGVAAARNTVLSYAFSLGNGAGIAHLYRWANINTANLVTGVRCTATGAVADPPTGQIDIGDEYEAGTYPYINYSATENLRTVWSTNSAHPTSPGFTPGSMSPLWWVSGLNTANWGSTGHIKVMPVIHQVAHNSDSEAPYALSEISLYVEYYRYTSIYGNPTDNPENLSLDVKMYLVLSRSECGYKRVTDAALPTQQPDFPAMPGGMGLTPYTGGSLRPAAAPRMARSATAPSSALTTSGSPTSATTSITSGSPSSSPADRIPSATSGSPTSSAASPSSIPTYPAQFATGTSAMPCGQMSALSSDAATNTIHDVLYPTPTTGTARCPDDATEGAQAIETFAASGRQNSSTWTAYASSNPLFEGWRWAAISQRDGSTMYVR